jgi:hypothetical protein
MMAWKEAMILRTSRATWQRVVACRYHAGVEAGSDKGQSVPASRTFLVDGSTRRRLADKKSMPRISLETAAIIKMHKNMRRPKESVLLTVLRDGTATNRQTRVDLAWE